MSAQLLDKWWTDYVRAYDPKQTSELRIQWIFVKSYEDEYGVIPEGFITDFGTIPWIVWKIPGLRPWGRYAFRYSRHDLDYASELGIGDGKDTWTEAMNSDLRKTCDDRLLDGLVKDEMDPALRNIVHQAVRKCGWWVWRKHTPESVSENRRFLNASATPRSIS